MPGSDPRLWDSRLRTAQLLFLILAGLISSQQTLANDEDSGEARAFILRVQGRTIRAHSARLPLAVASLNKLAGALVALEARAGRPGLLDEAAEISPAAARETGKRLGLRAGERMRGADLLSALLIVSANDACAALADHVAGSKVAFVARMNELARRLGMSNTTFVDPCGHDHPRQHSTAEDLARLAAAAMQEDEIMQRAGTRTARIATADGRRTFTLNNTNHMLGRYRGTIGLKTGVTRGAGPCLIAVARRDGVNVLLVLLGAANRWDLAASLLDSGFEHATALSPAGSR